MKIQKDGIERKKLIKKFYFVLAVPAKDECNILFSDYYVCYK